MIEADLAMDTVTLRQPGVAGSALLNGRTTLMLDIFELAGTVRPADGDAGEVNVLPPSANGKAILVAEDSDFFRGQIKRMIEAVGYRVLAAEDGESAWELLDHHAGEISAVTTDIDMPRLDGLGLTNAFGEIHALRACRSSPFPPLPAKKKWHVAWPSG